MAVNEAVTEKKPGFQLSVQMVVGLIATVLIGGFLAWLSYGPKPAPPPPPVLTQDAKDYLSNLQLSDVALQAAENYLNQSVVEVIGKITNHGPRAIKLIQVNCVFRNVYGQPIMRELATVAGPKTSLKSGETRSFRLPFDDPPAGWNQAMPDLVIARIQFE